MFKELVELLLLHQLFQQQLMVFRVSLHLWFLGGIRYHLLGELIDDDPLTRSCRGESGSTAQTLDYRHLFTFKYRF